MTFNWLYENMLIHVTGEHFDATVFVVALVEVWFVGSSIKTLSLFQTVQLM